MVSVVEKPSPRSSDAVNVANGGAGNAVESGRDDRLDPGRVVLRARAIASPIALEICATVSATIESCIASSSAPSLGVPSISSTMRARSRLL